MWLPDLADGAWAEDVLSRNARTLGLDGEVAAVELVDVRLTHPHRPGSRLCRGWATYVVTLADGRRAELYLKGFPDGATSEAAWRQDRVARPAGSSHHLPAHDLVVWRFPEDPSLPALPGLVAPELAPDGLPPAVADVVSPRGEPVRAAVVRYQPEASATLRVQRIEGGGPAVFAKHLADGTVTAVARVHEALWRTTRGPLRVAEPLAADPDRNVLWTRGVPGAPLTVALAPAQLPGVAAVIGEQLGALHESGVDVAGTVSLDDLLTELAKKAAKVAAGHPSVEQRVTELVGSAARRRGDVVHERRRPVHGDFHVDQLVTSRDGPVLVDLDSMVGGPPEVDLAEFLVDLALRGLPSAVAHGVADRLLSSYESTTGSTVDQAALEVCADAEFLNRCYRHLRRHTPGWEQDLETELARHADVAALLLG